MKIIITLAILFCSFLFWVCHLLEINTVDPQASSSIKESKNAFLFLKEYKAISTIPKHLFSIEEVWAEYDWKNKIVGCKVTKRKGDTRQINLKINIPKGSYYKRNPYLIKWYMKTSSGEFLSQAGDIYSIMSSYEQLPDSLNIIIGKIENNTLGTHIDSFYILSN